MKIDRDMNSLHPNVKARFEAFIKELRVTTGLDIQVSETYRLKQRQEECFNNGTSKVHYPYSWHNWGLAIDIFNNEPGKLYDFLKKEERGGRIHKIAMKYDIQWGYALWKFDKPHFQYTNGYTIEAIVRKPNLRDNFSIYLTQPIMKEVSISRFNSPRENQFDNTETAKYCQTYAFLNCVEHQHNKHLCYKNNIMKQNAPNYLKQHGLNLSEIDVQDYVKSQVFYNPLSKEPVQIGRLISFYSKNKIPGSDYVVSKAEKYDVKDREKLRDTIIRVLENKVPVWVSVRGRYTLTEINGVWHLVYTTPKTWGGGHAVMIDGWDGEHFYAEDSSMTPRCKIEDIRCITSCYAFEFKEV